MAVYRSVAVAMSFIGATVVQAQDSNESTEAPGIGSSEAAAPVTLWSELEEESSLLPQAMAATKSLRALITAENGVEVETIDATATLAASGTDTSAEDRDGYCQHLPRPGSRIMEERCFYPSRGEQALNEYQFRTEIDQIREQQALLFMENSEFYEDWVKAGRP